MIVRDLDRVSKEPKMSNSLFSEDLSSKTIKSMNHRVFMFYSISHKNTHFLSVNIFALRWDLWLDAQQIFWYHSHFNYLVSSKDLSKKQYSWRMKLRIICDISEYCMQTHKFGDTAETIDSSQEKMEISASQLWLNHPFRSRYCLKAGQKDWRYKYILVWALPNMCNF